MRKLVLAICEQYRRRSACACAQSDQHLCFSLLDRIITLKIYIQNSKPLASFCGCAGRFVSYLVENPEDRFSRDEAHIHVQLIGYKWLFLAVKPFRHSTITGRELYLRYIYLYLFNILFINNADKNNTKV